jgi:hypothetical protein
VLDRGVDLDAVTDRLLGDDVRAEEVVLRIGQDEGRIGRR